LRPPQPARGCMMRLPRPAPPPSLLEESDARVERSLYNRAVGYSFNSEKIFCNKDGEVTRVPIVEHVPPDVTAQIFWLKNRDPARWRDAWQVEHSLGKYVISDKPMTPGAVGEGARRRDRRDAERR
jgi:hypothetical protein